MTKDDILEYLPDLNRYATQKCSRQEEAEDLVSDTVLAALEFLHRGGVIEHPKTWLAHTMTHLWNKKLRKKYRTPVTVSFCSVTETADPDDPLLEIEKTDEGAAVRQELAYLAQITREVMIDYYIGGMSIEKIAENRGIPVGTVKSRLDVGRRQTKKGLETMENTTNILPGKLNVGNSGAIFDTK